MAALFEKQKVEKQKSVPDEAAERRRRLAGRGGESLTFLQGQGGVSPGQVFKRTLGGR